jgi:hypothetical protein
VCCGEVSEGYTDVCEFRRWLTMVHVSDNDSGTETIGKISDIELLILRVVGMHFIVQAEGNVEPYFASWTTVAVE